MKYVTDLQEAVELLPYRAIDVARALTGACHKKHKFVLRQAQARTGGATIGLPECFAHRIADCLRLPCGQCG